MSRRVVSEILTGPVPVPHVVTALAGRDVVTPVWRNELGGVTFRLDGAGAARYVKWTAAGTPEIDLAAEAERLGWARRWVAVPLVLAQGADAEGTWLVTAAVPGRSAVDPRWPAEPATAARAIGRGLRLLHDALPVAECPFAWMETNRPRPPGEHMSEEHVVRPIGRVSSPLDDPATAPKQGFEGSPPAALVFDPAVREGLRDLRPGSQVLVLTWLDRADRSVLAVHPRDDPGVPERGVFSTRSADRPNPIGLHRVRVVAVDGLTVHVHDLEAVDGTPVLDLKPVLDPLDG